MYYIECSTLMHDQTVSILERDALSGTARVGDTLGARNHFDAFNMILDHVDDSLSSALLTSLHGAPERSASTERGPLQAVDDYKLLSNEAVGAAERVQTSAAEDVPAFVDDYEQGILDDENPLRTTVKLHRRLEKIHSLSEGNGRA